MSKKHSSPQSSEYFQKLGAELVHDIATPLASMQLNVQSLTNYLPILLACYQERMTAQVTGAIPSAQLAALARLPDAIDGDVQKIRSISKNFLGQIAALQSSEQAPWEDMPVGHDARDKALQNKSRSNSDPLTTGGLSSRLRILLVEDEEIHRDIALRQLADKCVVDYARCGQEALAKCRGCSYDLVLLDYVLPGMDVSTLMDRLRPLLTDQAHIIGFSNMPSGSSYNGLPEGISACLDKPFRLDNFLAILQDLPVSRVPTEENEK